MTTTIKRSNGTTRTYDSRESAESALRVQYPGLVVSDDGARVLAWADEASATDDDGRRAIAELIEDAP